MMRLFALAFVGFGCLITLSGCSSPFLPHNAVKYIPEFSYAETTENVYPSEDLGETEQEENSIREETVELHSSYFSPESIKERYIQHIEDCETNNGNSLLDIVSETIDLMRRAGKTDDEIRDELIREFPFSSETVEELLKNETSSEKITTWKNVDKQGILLASVQIIQTHGATQEEITEMLKYFQKFLTKIKWQFPYGFGQFAHTD